jgi:hypothetical protein
MKIEIRVEGPQHFLEGNAKIDQAISKLLSKSAEQLKEFIGVEIDRSVVLATYANQAPDPEAVRAIYRSVHVVPDRTGTGITIEYGDEYAHLYGGTVDKEITDTITGLVDKAVQAWFNSPQTANMLNDTMTKETP